jgi:hypothetical protein
MFGRHSAIAAALMMGLSAAGGMVGITHAPTVTLNAPRRAKKRLFGGYSLVPNHQWRYDGPGTTAAQIKRASRKARNVKRHKAHAKG